MPSPLRRVRLDEPTVGSMRSRAVLSTVGVAAQGVLRFATSVLLAHTAGPGVVGQVSAIIATGTFLALLWPTSAGSAASKYVARARGAGRFDEASAVARQLGRETAGVAVLLAVAGLLWSVWRHGDVPAGLTIAVFVCAYSGYSYVRGVQFGAGQVRRATTWDVTSVGVALVGLVVALLAGVRGSALALPIAGSYLLYVLAGWPRSTPHRLERPLRHELNHFVLLGMSGTVASSGFIQLSMVVARASGTPVQAGYYAAALALATPPSLLAGSLSLALFPSMAEAWGRGDASGFHRQVDHAFRLSVLALVGVFGFLVLCSRLLVRLVFGAQFAPAQTLLPVLLLATLATSLAVPAANSLTTRSRRGMVVTSGASLAGLVLGLTVWAATAGRSGVGVVAAGYLAGALLIAALPVLLVWRRDSHAWGRLLLRLLLGALVLVGLVLLQHDRGLPTATDPLVGLAFVVLWVAASWPDARRLVPPLLRRT